MFILLPNDVVNHTIRQFCHVCFQITEVGKTPLPSWLVFNPQTAELKGIPGPQDGEVGQLYFEVKVTGDDNSFAKDVFSLQVLDDTNGQIYQIASGEQVKTVLCKQDEPQTMVTIVMDCDLDLMAAGQKMSLLDNVVSHLSLHPDTVKILPVGSKPMFESGALVVGGGNVKEPSTPGAFVSWMIGCGQVGNEYMAVLHQVETAAANGDMSAALGHNVIGWHVTNTRFHKPKKPRAATPLVTPVMKPPAPTKVVDMTTTQAITPTSVHIMPTQTIDVMPTKVTNKPDPTKPTIPEIKPSSTVKMTQTTMPTTSTPLATTAKPTVNKQPTVNMSHEDLVLEAGTINRNNLDEKTFIECHDNNTNNFIDLRSGDGRRIPADFCETV